MIFKKELLEALLLYFSALVHTPLTTIPAGYHSGGGSVRANKSSSPSVLYHNSSSTDGATSLQYSFPYSGTYRVCATACCITHNGNQTEFYTNGSISTNHHTNMWSKGGSTYGSIGEAPLGTVLIFMGDITTSTGQIVKILTKETQSFVTLFVERLP